MTWDGATDGDGDGVHWNDANNWQEGAVPGLGCDAYVPSAWLVSGPYLSVTGAQALQGAVVNAPLKVEAGSSLTTTDTFHQQGDLDVEGALTVGTGMASGGTMLVGVDATVTAQYFQHQGNFSLFGTLNVGQNGRQSGLSTLLAQTSQLNLGPDAFMLDGQLWPNSQITMQGTVNLASATTLQLCNAAVAFEEGITVNGEGLVETFFATASVNTDFALRRFDLNSSTLQGNNTLTLTNTFNWTDSVLRGGGTTVVAPGAAAHLNAAVANTLEERVFLNRGETRWESGYIYGAAYGTLHNNVDGTFIVDCNETMRDDDNTAVFLNDGVFVKEAPPYSGWGGGLFAMSGPNGGEPTTGDDATTIDLYFQNNFRVDVQSGILNFASGGLAEDGSDFQVAEDTLVEFGAPRLIPVTWVPEEFVWMNTSFTGLGEAGVVRDGKVFIVPQKQTK